MDVANMLVSSLRGLALIFKRGHTNLLLTHLFGSRRYFCFGTEEVHSSTQLNCYELFIESLLEVV